MLLELVPLVFGGLLAIAGLALVADGVLSDPALASTGERRRRPRAARHRGGEVAVGLGLLCAALALAVGDSWRFAPAAVMAGAALLLAGAAFNARYLAEQVTTRGALRRGRAAERRRLGSSPPPGDPDRRPHDRRLDERREAPPAR